MELKCLRTFRTIIDEGGFSKAAKKLNYTQSTITFQMNQLERDLSTTLFEKIGRKMVLTKAGEHLIPYVDDILQSVDKLSFLGEHLSECQGDIQIGVGESLLCYKLPAILKEFHRQAPKARLFLRSMNCYDIRDELFSGGLDLGVFYEDVGGFGSNLAVKPFGNYPVVLVASPEIQNRYPDFVTPDRTILRDKSIILDHTIELWSIPTIKNLVKNNVGISFLPEFTVTEELNHGELVKIPTDISGTKITAVCAHHKNKWVSPLMQLFIHLCDSVSCGEER